MKKNRKTITFNRAKAVMWAALGTAVFICVWWFLALGADNSLIFPTPWQCIDDLKTELCSSLFWRSFLGSLVRSTVGTAVAVAAAVAAGYLGKMCRPVKLAVYPVVGILRSLPTMSVILLAVLWLGDELTPLFVSGLVIFPTLYSGLDASLCSIDTELEETARLYSGNGWYTLTRVYVPVSAKPFVKICGGGASLSLKLTVAAEVMAQTRNSLGLIMQQTQVYFQMGRLVAITVITVAAGLVIELAFFAVGKLLEKLL